MSDGRNEARALRVLEIVNDFRTLQIHIRTQLNRYAVPPDSASASLMGYALLRQCSAESSALLAKSFNPGQLGVNPGSIPVTDAQKIALQRIILDVSANRFQAHRVYLRIIAAGRWEQLRAQVLNNGRGAAQNQRALQAVDSRLREELLTITDQQVFVDLRQADMRKAYWIADDPSLDRILAWLMIGQSRINSFSAENKTPEASVTDINTEDEGAQQEVN